MLPADFAFGCQWYLDALPSQAEAAPRVVLSVLVEDIEVSALLDTGATQCVLNWAIAEQLLSRGGEAVRQVRALGGGVHEGVLLPVVVTLLADEGSPLAIPAAAWSAETFSGPNLIGYGGLLEKVRFALEPAANRFYFGC